MTTEDDRNDPVNLGSGPTAAPTQAAGIHVFPLRDLKASVRPAVDSLVADGWSVTEQILDATGSFYKLAQAGAGSLVVYLWGERAGVTGNPAFVQAEIASYANAGKLYSGEATTSAKQTWPYDIDAAVPLAWIRDRLAEIS